MKLIPVMTEKSMKLVKNKIYTFFVPSNLTKIDIKELVGKTFSVEVKNVKTINMKSTTKKNFKGKVQTIKGRKKAIVTLRDGKIDLFEEEKKTKKVKKGKSDVK